MENYKNVQRKSRFFEPPRETKIGSKTLRVRKIGAKLVKTETTFASSYRRFEKLRVRKIGIIDSNVFCLLISQNKTNNGSRFINCHDDLRNFTS